MSDTEQAQSPLDPPPTMNTTSILCLSLLVASITSATTTTKEHRGPRPRRIKRAAEDPSAVVSRVYSHGLYTPALPFPFPLPRYYGHGYPYINTFAG